MAARNQNGDAPIVFGEDRVISVQARYMAMLEPFVSTESKRYYLNGIYIYPYPSPRQDGGGVIMVATDGHRLGIIHDAEGLANGPYICPVSRGFVKLCADAHKPKDSPASVVHFVGRGAYLVNGNFKDDDPSKIGDNHIMAEVAPPIDGTYPKWERVIPAGGIPKKAMCASFNPKYIADFQSVIRNSGSLLLDTITIFAGGGDGENWTDPTFVLVAAVPEFVGILMPTRTDKDTLPEWLTDIVPQLHPANENEEEEGK